MSKAVTLERQSDSLRKLVGINSIINSTLDIGSLLTLIMEKIKDIMESDASTLLLYDENTEDLVFKVALGEAGYKLQEKYRVKLNQGIAGWTAENKKSIYINDVYSDSRFDPNFDKKTGFVTKAIICAPLIFKGKLLGVIEAINPTDGKGFDDYHLELFNAFSNQAAIAIENASLYSNLEQKVEARTAELVEAYKKLKELDKAKTDFFANVSHELRTPLTLILSPVESILNGDYGDKINANDNIITSIHKNSIRLLTLINNLLDFSKIEAGKMTLKKHKSDVSKLFSHYSSSVQAAAKSKNLNITFVDNTKGVIAWIDQDLIEKAIYNLVSNALKFTKDGGIIEVELNILNENFSISVNDNGIGIENDMLDLIFERFNQADSSLSRKYEGTGIGLSLTKEIVQLHDGQIDVESKLGEGSKFTITIPLSIPENVESENLIENTQEIKSIEDTNPYLWQDSEEIKFSELHKNLQINDTVKTILLVDDNYDMISFLTTLLKKDYNIISATNGKEALSVLTGQDKIPDLIIADVMMPVMDGYELIQSIRANMKYEGLPIILLTAKAEMSKKVEGIEKGANDYIVKPFNPKELLARVKSQIELKSLRDKLVLSNHRLKQTMNDSSILVSDIGHKFYNELWPFAQMVMIGKTIIDRVETNNFNIDKEEITFAKENLDQCEKSLEKIEEMKNKIKKNFGKLSEKNFNRFSYIIDDVVNDYKNICEKNNIVFNVERNFENNKEIKASVEQIKIVFENILNNAIHALENLNKKDKIINIKVEYIDKKFIIIIEDNGIGIPGDICENIFTMFFGTDKGDKKGLGLGLHLTRWIVEDCHKGKINVESKQGEYTRFKIVLPEDGDRL